MDQQRIEKDRLRLKNAESIILELGLLAYPLLLIAANVRISPHYLIIVMAMVVGVLTYFLYETKSYSVIHGLLFSLLIAVPFYVAELSLSAVILIFVYACWRLQVNFGAERAARWNFLAMNTIIFTSFYFITRVYLLKLQAIEINQVNVNLFILLTVLYIALRYLAIGLLGRQQAGFKMGETNKVFAVILCVGMITYFTVLYFMEYLRTAILALFAFIFGGLFMFISAAATPFIEKGIAYLDSLREEEDMETEFDEFQMEEVQEFLSDTEVASSSYFLIVIVVIAVVALFIILRKRLQAYGASEVSAYKIWSAGRKKEDQMDEKPLYDYSMTTNTIRDAYRQFEREADRAKYPRFMGETVKEWFNRMGWATGETIFLTYDKVRYGSLTISEKDARHFVEELDEIKKRYFTKDV